MSELILSLSAAGLPVVVVGCGPVGLRKVRVLHEAGARVRVIDPCAAGADLPQGVERIARPYRAGDLRGARLVVAATGDAAVDAAVTAEAQAEGALVNRTSGPDAGDFTLSAVLRRDALTIGVSTGGESPAAAALVRDRIADLLGPEWGGLIAVAAAMRERWLTGGKPCEYNRKILDSLVSGGILDLLARGDTGAAIDLVERLSGIRLDPATDFTGKRER